MFSSSSIIKETGRSKYSFKQGLIFNLCSRCSNLSQTLPKKTCMHVFAAKGSTFMHVLHKKKGLLLDRDICHIYVH